MGKHEPMTAKAIANKIKAKGLQKIKYYCEMCKKQCRDSNGFKSHISSESHQRQALIVSENPDKFVNEFSKEFMDGFMYLLKTRYRSKRILANTVFQEYIKERDHIHMNGTRWTSLTEFAYWLSEKGIVKVDESERGVLITYIDKDPDTLRRQELDAKRAQQAKEAAERQQTDIEKQRLKAKKVYDQIHSNKEHDITPIPIVKVPLVEDIKSDDKDISGTDNQQSSSSSIGQKEDEYVEVVERPLFKIQTITLKIPTQSNYRPPPPKRRLTSKELAKKKNKTS